MTIVEMMTRTTSVPGYQGAPHVIERQIRSGQWIPVALGVRAHTDADAVREYRRRIPRACWTGMKLRARLQEQDQLT